MILFNTQFGPYLNYFLVASSSVLEDDEEGNSKFTPRWHNKRLVDEAELNTYTTDAFPLELYMLFGFFLLRFTRYILRTYVFSKWEEKHGLDIYKTKKPTTTMKDDKTLVVFKKNSKQKQILNEKVTKEENPDFQFNCWKKFQIKIYSLTYILEFILICRLVADVVLHTGYNITRIDYTKNKADYKLMFNHAVSFIALAILIFEIIRFIKINYRFMSGVLDDKYKKQKIKKFKKIKKWLKKKNKDENKNIELTQNQKNLMEKNVEDLNDEELDLIGDISMNDSDFSSDMEDDLEAEEKSEDETKEEESDDEDAESDESDEKVTKE
jgi:hypothetical protein